MFGPLKQEDLQVKIIEEPGSTPVWKKVDRLSPPQTVGLIAQLTKMLEAGIIQPSVAPGGAQYFSPLRGLWFKALYRL